MWLSPTLTLQGISCTFTRNDFNNDFIINAGDRNGESDFLEERNGVSAGEKGSTRPLLIQRLGRKVSQLGFTPTSSRQEIPSWVTMLASPYPASLGHLIFHPLRSAEGTLGLICWWQIPSRAQFLSGGNPHKISLSLRESESGSTWEVSHVGSKVHLAGIFSSAPCGKAIWIMPSSLRHMHELLGGFRAAAGLSEQPATCPP